LATIEGPKQWRQGVIPAILEKKKRKRAVNKMPKQARFFVAAVLGLLGLAVPDSARANAPVQGRFFGATRGGAAKAGWPAYYGAN
jgi:hypothetical protein